MKTHKTQTQKALSYLQKSFNPIQATQEELEAVAFATLQEEQKNE